MIALVGASSASRSGRSSQGAPSCPMTDAMGRPEIGCVAWAKERSADNRDNRNHSDDTDDTDDAPPHRLLPVLR